MQKLHIDMKELKKDFPFTFDIDFPHRKTSFGVRGLNPNANVKTPINIEKIIATAINRKFSLQSDCLNAHETKQAARVLAKTFNRKLKAAYARNATSKDYAYVGSDIDWLPDNEEKENFKITRWLVLLLVTATLRRKPLVFR